jgi:hypothetical protein
MTSQQIRVCAVAGVLAGVLALDGCGSGEELAADPTSTGAAATTAPSTALPEDLRGSWRRTMTARDWRPAGGGFPPGMWRLDVDRRGEVTVYLPHTSVVDFSTRFVVEGRRMTIAGVPICPGQTGRYTWHASARALRLSVVADDACKARAALFGGTWTRRS